MNYIGKFLSNFKEFYNEINTATLTGAIDVVVAQQEDGSFISSPFHVRFGKIGVLKSKEKIVDIEINGRPVDIHMKLGESGEAFFVAPVAEGEELGSAELATSPLPRPLPARALFTADESSPRPVDGRQLDSSEPFSLQGAAAELAAGAAVVGTPVNTHLSVAQLDCELPAPPADPHQPPTPGARAHMTVTDLSCDVVPAPGSAAADAHAHMTVTDVTTVPDTPGAAAQSTVTTDMSCQVQPRPGDSPVTFKARKVEKLVKLDGSTMFVPIKNTEKVCASTQTERLPCASGPAAPLESRASADDREPVKKRKSKKRKTAKHRRSLSETKVESAQDDEIFQMEDVKQEVRASRASLDDWTSRLNCPQDCHPFSDTDISPRGSPHSSRAATPIKSDTEFEIERERLVSDEGSQTDTTVWQWGELPSPSRSSAPPPPGEPAEAAGSGAASTRATEAGTASTVAATTTTASEERSMLSGMFSFMRKTKKARHDPVAEGIYLDDLNLESLDPEVAALYFPRSQALASGDKEAAVDSGADHCLDEDEGNGSSIPHSPSPSSPHSCDHRPLDLELGDVAMSLCGGLEGNFDGSVPESLFLQCLVTYDELCDEPRLLERPELVVRINGRYYNWATAAPLLCSTVMFRRPLPPRTLERLAEQTMPKKKPAKKGSGRSYSWWSWRRSGEPPPADNQPDTAQEAVQVETAAVTGAAPPPVTGDHPVITEVTESADTESVTEGQVTEPVTPTETRVTEPMPELVSRQDTETEGQITEPSGQVAEPSEDGAPPLVEPLSGEPLVEAAEEALSGEVAPGPLREDESRAGLEPADLTALTAECETQTGTPPGTPGRLWQSRPSSDTGERQRHSESDDTAEEEFGPGPDSVPGSGADGERLFKKTLRLSSEMIAKLGLHEGQNEALFSVTTAYQGTSRCKCNIFLWRYDDKIVVSDIDGTITKSDVLGHILPIVGQNWAQSGVAALYSKIRDNGYKFLYLSARAIGQAPITREYLKSVRQGDLSLPDGPLLLSPSSLVSALHREVIERRPEDFKIPCLRDIQALFPGRNPLYAGYGNRVNDAFAYRAVGIPSSRIFTINHRGELRHELTQTFQSSFLSQAREVDWLFPPPLVRRESPAVAVPMPVPQPGRRCSTDSLGLRPASNSIDIPRRHAAPAIQI
ncbi:phosphatidate phosphatase LPIN1-like isoform X1 [Amphibalanus amphitrite]|uniref:phosphatidate phosphatase LPIN1-like isoform X1 n=1 Tax=Amphibalanus amphitrite TaxID=1232801 RepID=UPI001C920F0C|nr:phosphatidate phosphatase LPIN1-like isoform X1 [Amphibalanus amphitrite]